MDNGPTETPTRACVAVLLAVPGLEALDWARREKPDLVVTELLLLDVTALGLCRLLREDPALGHRGILVVTSLASEIGRVLASR